MLHARCILSSSIWQKLDIQHSTIYNSERCMFWDKIRTDGTDVEFIFKKDKRPKSPSRLTPTAVKQYLKSAAVWGMDPRVTYFFVAADRSLNAPHRVRSISAREYCILCGYERATQKRKDFWDHDDNLKTKKLIDGIPSLKTTQLPANVTSVQYRFQHHRAICKFYDRNGRINRL